MAIGGGGAFGDFAGEAEADDLRHEHGDRLAEHGRLGLNAADAPAEHAETIHHRRVRVGADESVRVGGEVAISVGGRGEDDAGEVLEVDLVADAHAGRDGREVVEGGLAPLEKGVALAVAAELERGVQVVGIPGAVLVDLYGVVDDEFGGDKWIDVGDLFGAAAESLHRIAHGGEIDDRGDAGEVLHEHAGGHVGDLAGRLGLGVPAGEEANVVGGDGDAVFAADEVFEQDAEGKGELCEVEAVNGSFERGKGVVVNDSLPPVIELAGGIEGVGMLGGGLGGHTGLLLEPARGLRLAVGLGAQRTGRERERSGVLKIAGLRAGNVERP